MLQNGAKAKPGTDEEYDIFKQILLLNLGVPENREKLLKLQQLINTKPGTREEPAISGTDEEYEI